MNCWKSKNQSTKYTISGKTNSSSIKKINISRNPSKKLFHENRNSTLHFPNTMFEQFASLTSNKDLCKTSSKSIKLSRKCNLSQIKEDRIKDEDKFALVPRIKTTISMSKSPVVSLSSQSFYDCTDTVSTGSTLSAPSFKIENKKTFANIERKSVSRIASQYLHPDNSEYEINVLHYENDVLPGTNFSHSLQSHLNSFNTNYFSMDDSSLAEIQTKNRKTNKKNLIKSNQQEIDSTIHDIKYSWEIDDWMPSRQRTKCDNRIKDVKIYNKKSHDCEMKYSWQVIGTSAQTSYTLLQNLLNNINAKNNKFAYKMCSIKYSWQIIGTGTQASLLDNYNDPDYWSGILLTGNKNCNENSPEIDNNETDCTKLQDPEEGLKKYLMLNNQQTQTFADKEIQANSIDCCAKYSWHKLIKSTCD